MSSQISLPGVRFPNSWGSFKLQNIDIAEVCGPLYMWHNFRAKMFAFVSRSDILLIAWINYLFFELQKKNHKKFNMRQTIRIKYIPDC